MPTITFTITETKNILEEIAKSSVNTLRAPQALNAKNDVRVNVSLRHINEESKETWSDKDFDSYKSFFKIDYTERD
jgi:hypothetical protein